MHLHTSFQGFVVGVAVLRHLSLKLKDNKLSPDLKYDQQLDYMVDVDSLLPVHVEIKLFS